MPKATRPSKLLDGTSDLVLTYEDKDGDWMLVEDVPWRMGILVADTCGKGEQTRVRDTI
ncbi:hypothetical protein RND81_04G105700 [Saponaria officinalis]|uniref:Auxin-responsive protein n=1 Tax=Saponaria officinalis TaxID=3572 RepID=A0AAW1LJW9_SAPOF